MIPTTICAIAVTLAAITLAQPSPPAQGIQLSDPSAGSIVVQLPLMVSQCEPVLIFYDSTSTTSGTTYLGFSAPDDLSHDMVRFNIPTGIGYLEWVCDIPAGYAFVASYDLARYYVVQPGLSSSCLHDVTTTYAYLSYATAEFHSYTANPSNTSVPPIDPPATATVSFPTGSFSTVTANPDLVPLLTASQTSSSSSSSSSNTTPASTTTPLLSSSRPSGTGSTSVVVGAVIGGLVLIVLISGIIFILLRKRRGGYLPAGTSEPIEQFGLLTLQPPYPAVEPQAGTSFPSSIYDMEGSFQQPYVDPRISTVTPFSLVLPGSPHASASSKSKYAAVFNEPAPQARDGKDPQSNLAAALDVVSHLHPTADQRQLLINSLNSSNDPATSSHLGDQTLQTHPSPATGSFLPEPNLTAALHAISQLNLSERQALASILNLITPQPSAIPAEGEPRVISPAPPPYAS